MLALSIAHHHGPIRVRKHSGLSIVVTRLLSTSQKSCRLLGTPNAKPNTASKSLKSHKKNNFIVCATNKRYFCNPSSPSSSSSSSKNEKEQRESLSSKGTIDEKGNSDQPLSTHAKTVTNIETGTNIGDHNPDTPSPAPNGNNNENESTTEQQPTLQENTKANENTNINVSTNNENENENIDNVENLSTSDTAEVNTITNTNDTTNETNLDKNENTGAEDNIAHEEKDAGNVNANVNVNVNTTTNENVDTSIDDSTSTGSEASKGKKITERAQTMIANLFTPEPVNIPPTELEAHPSAINYDLEVKSDEELNKNQGQLQDDNLPAATEIDPEHVKQIPRTFPGVGIVLPPEQLITPDIDAILKDKIVLTKDGALSSDEIAKKLDIDQEHAKQLIAEFGGDSGNNILIWEQFVLLKAKMELDLQMQAQAQAEAAALAAVQAEAQEQAKAVAEAEAEAQAKLQAEKGEDGTVSAATADAGDVEIPLDPKQGQIQAQIEIKPLKENEDMVMEDVKQSESDSENVNQIEATGDNEMKVEAVIENLEPDIQQDVPQQTEAGMDVGVGVGDGNNIDQIEQVGETNIDGDKDVEKTENLDGKPTFDSSITSDTTKTIAMDDEAKVLASETGITASTTTDTIVDDSNKASQVSAVPVDDVETTEQEVKQDGVDGVDGVGEDGEQEKEIFRFGLKSKPDVVPTAFSIDNIAAKDTTTEEIDVTTEKLETLDKDTIEPNTETATESKNVEVEKKDTLDVTIEENVAVSGPVPPISQTQTQTQQSQQSQPQPIAQAQAQTQAQAQVQIQAQQQQIAPTQTQPATSQSTSAPTAPTGQTTQTAQTAVQQPPRAQPPPPPPPQTLKQSIYKLLTNALNHLKSRIDFNYVLHLGNFCAIISVFLTDILSLRIFLMMANLFCGTYYRFSTPPMMKPFYWAIFFACGHLGMILRILFQQRSISLTDEESNLYTDAFAPYGYTPVQFKTLYKKGKIKKGKKGTILCTQGRKKIHTMYLLDGEVKVLDSSDQVIAVLNQGFIGRLVNFVTTDKVNLYNQNNSKSIGIGGGIREKVSETVIQTKEKVAQVPEKVAQVVENAVGTAGPVGDKIEMTVADTISVIIGDVGNTDKDKDISKEKDNMGMNMNINLGDGEIPVGTHTISAIEPESGIKITITDTGSGLNNGSDSGLLNAHAVQTSDAANAIVSNITQENEKIPNVLNIEKPNAKLSVSLSDDNTIATVTNDISENKLRITSQIGGNVLTSSSNINTAAAKNLNVTDGGNVPETLTAAAAARTSEGGGRGGEDTVEDHSIEDTIHLFSMETEVEDIDAKDLASQKTWNYTLIAATDVELLVWNKKELHDYTSSNQRLKEASIAVMNGDLKKKLILSKHFQKLATYKNMLHIAVSTSSISKGEMEKLENYRMQNSITDMEHQSALQSVGWTLDEYERGRKMYIPVVDTVRVWFRKQMIPKFDNDNGDEESNDKP